MARLSITLDSNHALWLDPTESWFQLEDVLLMVMGTTRGRADRADSGPIKDFDQGAVGSWEWTPGVTEDPLAGVRAAAQAAQNASRGDSNDEEIDLLREALEEALRALGLELPDPEED